MCDLIYTWAGVETEQTSFDLLISELFRSLHIIIDTSTQRGVWSMGGMSVQKAMLL